MNKPVCLGFLIRGLSKTLMYEFWCNYVKPKFDEKPKYDVISIQTVSLYTWKQMIFTKTLRKMLKVDLMKDELEGKIMTKSVGLRAKTDSYLVDESSKD